MMGGFEIVAILPLIKTRKMGTLQILPFRMSSVLGKEWRRSDRRHPGDVEIRRIERRRRADEEPVQFRAAEADVGDGLGDADLAQKSAVGRVAMHAVAGGGPDPSVPIQPEAVE